MSNLAARLAQAQVFKSLPPAECVELARLACRRTLAPGEFLCHLRTLAP
jgi:hypothetical protein